MRRRVRKWGSSRASTLPKALTREIGRENMTVAPRYTLDELLAAIRPSNLHKETDWGCAVGQEIW
jgi:antitoxin component of MazEF toxin-antitoxin module